MKRNIRAAAATTLWLILNIAAPLDASALEGEYLIKSSDLLSISVWKEEGLQMDVVVRPDGRISFPLVGEVEARGKTVEAVRTTLAEKLDEFIPDPVVTVVLAQSIGNRVFVIGKVQNPGVFALAQNMDVMQALALGGGLATFADDNKITILRRAGGSQTAIPFNYSEVEYGNALEQNILLEPGDVVVVP